MIRGFTLIELSIVLLIIGLIVAAITAASSLVESARLQSLVSDLQTYERAFRTFESAYQAYPGDMVNAESYWGSGASGTSNGDGDFDIEYDGFPDNEQMHAMQQVAKAELLGTDITGTPSVSEGFFRSFCPSIDIHSDGGVLYLTHSGPVFGVRPTAVHIGRIFDYTGGGSWMPWGAVMTPLQTFQLDEKIDDGIPNKGKLIAMEGGDSSFTRGVHCLDQDWATASQSTATSYRLNLTGVNCRALYGIKDYK